MVGASLVPAEKPLYLLLVSGRNEMGVPFDQRD